MELKLAEKVKAAVELDGQVVINMDNSSVYESIEKEEMFLYIKSTDGKEIKIRFLKKE